MYIQTKMSFLFQGGQIIIIAIIQAMTQILKDTLTTFFLLTADSSLHNLEKIQQNLQKHLQS